MLMRRIPVWAAWCLLLMMGVLLPGQAMATAPRIVVNGQNLITEVQPVIENGRTLVPLSGFGRLGRSQPDGNHYQRLRPVNAYGWRIHSL